MMKLHMSYVKMMSPAFMIACVLNVPNIWQQLWLIIWSQHYTCFPPQQPELQCSLTQQMSKRSKSKWQKKTKKNTAMTMTAKLFPELGKLSVCSYCTVLGISSANPTVTNSTTPQVPERIPASHLTPGPILLEIMNQGYNACDLWATQKSPCICMVW